MRPITGLALSLLLTFFLVSCTRYHYLSRIKQRDDKPDFGTAKYKPQPEIIPPVTLKPSDNYITTEAISIKPDHNCRDTIETTPRAVKTTPNIEQYSYSDTSDKLNDDPVKFRKKAKRHTRNTIWGIVAATVIFVMHAYLYFTVGLSEVAYHAINVLFGLSLVYIAVQLVLAVVFLVKSLNTKQKAEFIGVLGFIGLLILLVTLT